MRCRARERWQRGPMAGYTGAMTTTEQILAAALGLPAEERVRLVDALVQSLDDDDSPVSEAEREAPGSPARSIPSRPCGRVSLAGGESQAPGAPMILSLRVRPEAEADMSEAYTWYAQRGLGEELIEAIEDRLRQIQAQPKMYPVIHRDVRRARVRRARSPRMSCGRASRQTSWRILELPIDGLPRSRMLPTVEHRPRRKRLPGRSRPPRSCGQRAGPVTAAS